MSTSKSAYNSDPAFYPDLIPKKGQSKNKKSPILNRPGYATFVPHSKAIVTKEFGVKDKQYAAGYHTGIDIAVPGSSGQKIVWPMPDYDGRVMVSAYDKPGYGHYNLIKPIPIKIDPTKLTVGQKIVNTASPKLMKPQDPILFGHMEGPGLPEGTRVSYGGEKIGNIGNTGHSNGAHLHIEYRKSGSPLTYGEVDDPKIRFKIPNPVGAVGIAKESNPNPVVAAGISKEPKNSRHNLETNAGVTKTARTLHSGGANTVNNNPTYHASGTVDAGPRRYRPTEAGIDSRATKSALELLDVETRRGSSVDARKEANSLKKEQGPKNFGTSKTKGRGALTDNKPNNKTYSYADSFDSNNSRRNKSESSGRQGSQSSGNITKDKQGSKNSGTIGISGRGSLSGNISNPSRDNNAGKSGGVKKQSQGGLSGNGNADRARNNQIVAAQVNRRPANTNNNIAQNYLKPNTGIGLGGSADSSRSALVGGIPATSNRAKSGGPGKPMLK